MDVLSACELWLGRLGGLAALLTLALALARLSRAIRQPPGTAVGRTGLLRSRAAYAVATLLFLGLCALLWRPLPLALAPGARIALLALGAPLLLGGLGLYLWGLRALGPMYGGSTSLGAALYAGHRLITGGPYAYLRHPMYGGLVIAAFGGLLLYRTWTAAFLALSFLGLARRARREEQALHQAFGAVWEAYARRVPGWLPRFRRRPGE